MPERWTIDELAARVAAVLAANPAGPTSGRVRDVPDRRAIRWYTTIGLLDRPYPTGGRVAHYGWRHLLQLVAIKRRQAAGYSLAAIQAELVGATDDQLAAIAAVSPPDDDQPVGQGGEADRPQRDRARFWRERPVELPTVDVARVPEPGIRIDLPVHGHRTADPDDSVSYGVPVAPGVMLLIHSFRPPADDDIAAIRSAAAPLLQLLHRRDLLPEPPPTHAGVDPAPSQGRQE